MMRRQVRVFVLLLTNLSLMSAAGALRADLPAGVRLQAFNGTNLDSWQVSHCDTRAANGTLSLRGSGFVRTDFPYQDFVFELKWREDNPAAGDPAVFFRAASFKTGQPSLESYRVSLKKGSEGNIGNLPGARSSGLIKNEGWNALKLKVEGSRAIMQINGAQAWQVDGVAESSGHLGLVVDGVQDGWLEFRDIFITELGYTSLFNGRDLSDWDGVTSDAAQSWKVEDNQIVCTGQRGTWLRSKQQYGDFNFRLEYKLRPGGNSGVYVRVPADGNHHEGGGTEIQILDDKDPRYKDIEPGQFAASVYKIAPALRHVGRVAGEWNTLEINCQGPAYRINHNGIVVVDASADMFPELKQRFLEGYLGLQNHDEEVWFRNLRIGPAQPASPAEPGVPPDGK